jgi:D-serine deaminase-like pyridoxal phosphate-dependent protein
LSNDAARGFSPTPGYGLVFPTLTATAPDPSIVIERLSEEHATARVAPHNPLKPGDRVRIVPNHTCVVTNLANDLTIMDGHTVLERMPVAARGRNY